jgi:hypothetical protein
MFYDPFEEEESAFVNAVQMRTLWQDFCDTMRSEMGADAFTAMLLKETGFPSAAAFIDAEVNGSFSNRVYSYYFNIDRKALFLDEWLPANKGRNELSNRMYYGTKWDGSKEVKNTDETYVFTFSDYTNSGDNKTIIGSYAYDSSQKRVWLKPSTIDGKDRRFY